MAQGINRYNFHCMALAANERERLMWDPGHVMVTHDMSLPMVAP